MDLARLQARLMETYVAELEEHVAELNGGALALESEGDAARRSELVRTLFRTAHSLKGASRAVEQPAVEKACHLLEGVLSKVRDGVLPSGPALVDILLKGADAFADAASRLRANRPAEGPLLGALTEALAAAEAGSAAAPVRPPPAPAEQGGGGTGTPADGTEEAAPEPEPQREAGRTVRVASARLDGLLARSGELRLVLRRLRREATSLGQPADGRDAAAGGPAAPAAKGFDALLASVRAAGLAADLLDGEVRALRLLPFSEACEALPRAVRDVARLTGKEATFAIEGEGVEIDRSVLQALKDPLLHLVRNAVDHGSEGPEERMAAGKARAVIIKVAASLEGSRVLVRVSDDGRGMDPAAIRARAIRTGLPVPEDDAEAFRLVFLPGFSTSAAVTGISGRGVGLDVVRSRVESLGGSVDVASVRGAGTTFSLRVPLTLTVVRALVVEAGGHPFAIPSAGVDRLLRVAPEELRPAGGRETLLLGGPPVPAVSLAGALGLPLPPAASPGQKIPFVVLSGDGKQAAFALDRVRSEEEILVKELGPRVLHVRHVSGAAVLPSGEVALVLTPQALVRTALAPSAGGGAVLRAERPAPRRRLLVVEDSPTIRSLEQAILEAAGYAVVAAPDGEEAWRLLGEREFDAVVSDIEMPWLDGFALTEAIRSSPRLAKLPVVLLTSRESDGDRARGLAAGADAYLVKSAFDQANLLETISQLL